LRALIGAKSTDPYHIALTEATLFGLRNVELTIAAQKSKWQKRAAEDWANAKKLSDPLPNLLTGIAGEMNPNADGYNIVIDSEHAFINLGSAKKSIGAVKQSLVSAKGLDPRLKEFADAGLAEMAAFEDDAAKKVEQICSIYLNSKIQGGVFLNINIFDSRYGAYNWCTANPKNRWSLFPTPT
jgi:hypothetical protein